VGVHGEVGDDLVGVDAVAERPSHGLAGDVSGHHVREPGPEVHKEVENRDLERRVRVRVHAVVGLQDDEPATRTATATATEHVTLADGVVHGGGGGAAGAGVGGEGGGETGGVEAAGGGLALIDEAVVAQVLEHLDLSGAEGGEGVVAAELERAEHEDEVEDVDGVHLEVRGHVEVLDQQGPDLGVDVLEQELEARVGDDHAAAGRALHEAAVPEQREHALVGDLGGGRADHEMQYALPALRGVLVQEPDVHPVLVLGVAGDAEGVAGVVAAGGERVLERLAERLAEHQRLALIPLLDQMEALQLLDPLRLQLPRARPDPQINVRYLYRRVHKHHRHDQRLGHRRQQPKYRQTRRRRLVQPR
jgi:hypothetical protein